jgi:hypothetical protein
MTLQVKNSTILPINELFDIIKTTLMVNTLVNLLMIVGS